MFVLVVSSQLASTSRAVGRERALVGQRGCRSRRRARQTPIAEQLPGAARDPARSTTYGMPLRRQPLDQARGDGVVLGDDHVPAAFPAGTSRGARRRTRASSQGA